MNPERNRFLACFTSRGARWGLVVAVLLLATVLRGSGVYRGIPFGVSYHPDVAKQVQALDEYLQGKYIWYTGLRFYDSYPLFLNHFDEWIIRLVRAAACPAARYLGRDCDPSLPATETLYYWTMTLRWLYGVAVVLITGWIARRLRFPFPAAVGAMLLVAISPLNIVTAHYGTGDIACDLFFVLTALCTAQHARTGRAPWLAAAGVMAGWTFAGKYNGGMAALLIAGYAALLCVRGRKRLGRFIGMGLLSAGGFVAGVLIAMPQFLWAWKRTWRDMLRVFEHVQNYRVPEEFLKLPVWDRAWIAFSHNVGGMLWALGVLGLLAGLAGLWIAIRHWRKASTRTEVDEPYRCQSLLVALFVFPWLVLFLSLASKLNLHPFYFSWIYPALALAAMHALTPLLARDRTPGRLVFGLLALLLLGESGVHIPAEVYFWQREDVRTLSRHQEHNPVLPETRNGRYRASEHKPTLLAIRDFLLEPRNVANFRNRWGRLESPDAPAWRKLAVMPLPVIPFGGPLTDWVMLNGPALPRSDWSFKVADDGIDVIVVAFAPLQDIRLGFQTGVYPACIEGQWGGAPVRARLGANDWTVVTLKDLHPVRVMQDQGRSGLPIYHYRLRLRASPGPAWAMLLQSPQEEKVFRLFGGDPSVDLAALFDLVDPAVLADMTARIRYRTGDAQWRPLPAGEERTLALWDPDEVLPAGPFRLKLNAIGLGSNTVLRLKLLDKIGRTEVWSVARQFDLAPGKNELAYSFEKPFAPFQCAVAVEIVSGEALVGEWSLWPDVPALAAAASQVQRPAWQRQFADSTPPVVNRHAIETTFGGRITVHEVAWPDAAAVDQRQSFSARISLLKPLFHFEEHEVFIHLCNADGQPLMAAHLPMKQVVYATNDSFSVMLKIPEDVAPQIRKVKVGVWNRRTRLRLSVTDHPADIRECSRNMVEFDVVPVNR
jgi:hypothetical protein